MEVREQSRINMGSQFATGSGPSPRHYASLREKLEAARVRNAEIERFRRQPRPNPTEERDLEDTEESDADAMSKDNDPAAFASVAGGIAVGAVIGFLAAGIANSSIIQSQLAAATKAITANPTNYGLTSAPSSQQIALAATQQVMTTVAAIVVVEIVASALLYYVAYRAERRGAHVLLSAAVSGVATGLLLAGIGTGIAQWQALSAAEAAVSGTTTTTPVLGFLY